METSIMKDNSINRFNLKDFSNLDDSKNADFLIRSMKVHYSVTSMLKIKQRSLELLDIQTKDTVLEIGCGLGLDTEAIAEKNYLGKAVGIDCCFRMIQEAKNKSTHNNAEYLIGNAEKLPFPNGYFDKCRMERLLISQKSINTILSEAIRVIKPNGKICITDLDFGSIVLFPYMNNVTEAVVKYWQSLVENPFIGRQLLDLLNQYNLSNIYIEPEVFSLRHYDTLKNIVQFETMLQDMRNNKLINEEELNNFIAAINQADDKGSFFWSINLFTVVATKT
jgi:ubiquinone/menaquinone biosynthesis C-methylase UbiE